MSPERAELVAERMIRHARSIRKAARRLRHAIDISSEAKMKSARKDLEAAFLEAELMAKHDLLS